MPVELEDPDDVTIGGESSVSDFICQDKAHAYTTTASEPTTTSTVQSLKQSLHALPKEIRNILAGGLAGMAAKTVVAPVDRIKILYQVSSTPFELRKVPTVARHIIQQEGSIAALWKGNTATLIRVFPYAGIQFMVFERCKSYCVARHADKRQGLSPLESLMGGMIAGTVSVMSTYPLDLVRTQLAVLKKEQAHSNTVATVMSRVYQQQGTTGLFRGIVPSVIGILPYSGIAFALNEQGKRKVRYEFF